MRERALHAALSSLLIEFSNRDLPREDPTRALLVNWLIFRAPLALLLNRDVGTLPIEAKLLRFFI